MDNTAIQHLDPMDEERRGATKSENEEQVLAPEGRKGSYEIEENKKRVRVIDGEGMCNEIDQQHIVDNGSSQEAFLCWAHPGIDVSGCRDPHGNSNGLWKSVGK